MDTTRISPNDVSHLIPPAGPCATCGKGRHDSWPAVINWKLDDVVMFHADEGTLTGRITRVWISGKYVTVRTCEDRPRIFVRCVDRVRPAGKDGASCS